MKDKYNLSNIYEKICKSEFDLKEDIINFGEEAWPLTRNMLWEILPNLENSFQNEVSISNNLYNFRSLDLKKLNTVFRNFLKRNFFLLSKKSFFKNSEIIFFSRSVYLEKLNSGKLFDRVIDPLFFTASINNCTSKFYIDNPNLKNIYFFEAFNYFPNSFIQNKKLYKSEYKALENLSIFFLKSFIEKNNFEEIEYFLVNELKKRVKSYLISKKILKFF